MAYIGREPQIGNYQICDAVSVVNGQAAYTMQVGSTNVIPESVNHMIVSLNGVIQKPGSSYTISSSTITFSSNLATGDSIDFIYLLGNVLDLGTPSDDTVTGAKIVDNAINSEHYTDGSIDTAHIADLNVTTGKIAADAITGAKIADNAIDSEHYTDGSIDTAHIAADQITEAKIADNAISEEHLDVTAVTGHTAETSIADGDLVLIHDASASALRKMTKANFVSGIGGTNTPFTTVKKSSDQTLNHGNDTKITFDSVINESSSDVFDLSNNKFTVPSGEGGTYLILPQLRFYDSDNRLQRAQCNIFKNNSVFKSFMYYDNGYSGNQTREVHLGSGFLETLSAGDYIEMYAYIALADSGSLVAESDYQGTSFGFMKIIT